MPLSRRSPEGDAADPDDGRGTRHPDARRMAGTSCFQKYIDMRDGQCTAISTRKPDEETASQEGNEMGRLKVLALEVLVLALVLSSGGGLVAKAETAKSKLAAQIRSQGFACDKPLHATRDANLSKPNYAVWVLKCENATYRIGRYPNLAAKVEEIR
jgi:hypothetical protein